MDLFDFIKEEELEIAKYKKQKSTDWKWTMANDYPKEKNGLKVFSCFACGGGSTMGYKLAGCEVLGCCEIDPRMNKVYVENHKPKYNYLMDIRDFNKLDDLPEELYDLDILDGSPPCTTFSMAGDREDSWGKKKKFREGQVEQTLDDLSFVFIETVAKLRPKVMIMENVEGLIKGEAWSYVQRIYKDLSAIGYKCRHWLLKGENMGVPQKRHRVFFVATRIDFDLDKVDMVFNYKPITYSEIENGSHKIMNIKKAEIAKNSKVWEHSLSETFFRIFGEESYFSEKIIYRNEVCKTITAGGNELWIENTGTCLNDNEFINAQSFPQDYNFFNEKVKYVCGMSVPPVMIKRIVNRLIESGIFEYKLKKINRGNDE
jgi:DNA (cytosine-5)-methyltransferase 1